MQFEVEADHGSGILDPRFEIVLFELERGGRGAVETAPGSCGTTPTAREDLALLRGKAATAAGGAARGVGQLGWWRNPPYSKTRTLTP